MGGVEAIKAIRAEYSDARIVVLTTYDGDAQAVRALKAGAAGYLLKSSLRTAMLYQPDGRDYRLRLAQALAANGDSDQAIAYFSNLWESQPSCGC